jgi:hypothetical protein
VWAAEFQGGPVSTHFHKGRVPSAEDIRRWMLTAVGCGVTAISFWVTRAEIHAAEMNGFSLLDSFGDTTPRYEEAARIGAALNRRPDLFAQPTRPWSEVAILIDENNYQFCNTLEYGAGHQPYSVRGWYRLLWDLGIPVDFVETSELDAPYAQAYHALILPFPLSISEEVARKLERYVRAGGNLISEAAPGRINDHCYANRGELSPTLAALFGVAQQSLTMVREPDEAQRWMPQERTWGEFLDAATLAGAGPLTGHSLRANLYIETVALQGAAPLLHYGDAAAGAVNAAGDGRAWLLGTYAGHSGSAYRDPANHACIEALMAACGVAPHRHGDLLIRKRVAPGAQAWLLTNPTRHEVTATLEVPAGASVADLLDGPVSAEGGRVTVKVASLDVRVLVLENLDA